MVQEYLVGIIQIVISTTRINPNGFYKNMTERTKFTIGYKGKGLLTITRLG